MAIPPHPIIFYVYTHVYQSASLKMTLCEHMQTGVVVAMGMFTLCT